MLRVLVRVFAGLIFLAGLTPVSSPAQAAGPWYVAPGGKDSSTCLAISSPCATIGGVLNKAGFTNGDIINVAAGTYTGTGNQVVRFAANKGAVLNGGWDAGFTTQSGLSVLDGQSARRVVSIDFAVVSMNHFTIQHGYSLTGAGIRVVNMGSLTFTDGYILNNRAPLDSGASVGGGVYYMGRFLDIKRTVAYGNEANGGSFFYGSGTVLFEQVDAYANPSNYHEFAFEGGTFMFNHSKLHDQQGTVIY